MGGQVSTLPSGWLQFTAHDGSPVYVDGVHVVGVSDSAICLRGSCIRVAGAGDVFNVRESPACVLDGVRLAQRARFES